MTTTQPPAPTEATARDVVETILSRPGVLEGPIAGQPLTPEEARFLASGVTDAILAALAAKGLCVVPEGSIYESLPFGQTWHDCEGCGMRFVADEDQDHLWAFEGSPVRCPHCYDAALQPEDQR